MIVHAWNMSYRSTRLSIDLKYSAQPASQPASPASQQNRTEHPRGRVPCDWLDSSGVADISRTAVLISRTVVDDPKKNGLPVENGQMTASKTLKLHNSWWLAPF